MNHKKVTYWLIALVALLIVLGGINIYLSIDRNGHTRRMVTEEVAKYADRLTPVENNTVKVVEVKPQDGQDGENGEPGKDGQSIKGDRGDKGDKGDTGKTLEIMWSADGELLTRYTGDDVWQEVPKEVNEVIN